jgi:O-antigen/teichoic acid export membrane protein
MSLEQQIFRGASWMAFFNSFSQIFSWIITIIIARILAPSDYGLMSMATIITGYAMILSELGLGNAIIQRQDIKNSQLSSVFWFAMFITTILAVSCFPIAYITASIMHEPRVIPITKAVSIIFIFNGLTIMPSSLLRKKLDFKSIGSIDIICVTISSLCMIFIAKRHGGVWTLVGGHIIRSFLYSILLFRKSKWLPSFHFNFKETKPLIAFGLISALGRSVFYVQGQADRFFAGRAWNANILGLYTMALELSQLPTNKITSLINNVSFPAFAKIQNDQAAFNKLYLNISKTTVLVVLPLFIGGAIIGDNLIKVLLNEKWYPIIDIFRLLCIAQIFTSMNAINAFVNTAQGKPQMGLLYNTLLLIFMPASFYYAVKFGFNAIVIPWLSVYVILCIFWIFVTLRILKISISTYCLNLKNPFVGTSIMSIVLFFVKRQNISFFSTGQIHEILTLVFLTITGAVIYLAFLWTFDKNFFLTLKKLSKNRC